MYTPTSIGKVGQRPERPQKRLDIPVISGGVTENLDFNCGGDLTEKNIDFRHHTVFDEVFATVAALPDRKVLDDDNRAFSHLEREVGEHMFHFGPASVALHFFLLSLKSAAHLSGVGL
jgi:hypothetical protein